MTFNARVASDLNPATDNTYDLGVTGHEWRNLNIDGTANIDSLVADTADIDGGTIDATAIGGSTAAAGAFTTLGATGLVTINNTGGTAPTPALPLINLVGSSTNRVVNLFTFGGNSAILARRANGTVSSPTALLNGENAFVIRTGGYGATAFDGGNGASIQFPATENWTDSAQGQNVLITATENGATVSSTIATFSSTGLNSTAIGATTPSTVAATTLSASGASTFPNSAPSAIGGLGFRNRIINGDMRIDQRNEGASLTNAAATVAFPVDRFFFFGTSASKFSAQRNAAAITPPPGFTNYVGITSLAATTPASSDVYSLYHRIEGLNVADLGFGAAGAKTVTLSFWVRSSLTGSFGGTLNNSASNRSYPYSYSISAANTWEQKTVSVSGDTTGTWLTTNGVGLGVQWDLGSGSTFRSTAGSWQAGNYLAPTGATDVIGTSGATLYITGVQLEIGNAATEFERRPFGQELSLCQRYYQKTYNIGVVPGTGSLLGSEFFEVYTGVAASTAGNVNKGFRFAGAMRDVPSVVLYSDNSGAANAIYVGADRTGVTATSGRISVSGWRGISVDGTSAQVISNGVATSLHWTASAEF